jgi:chromosome segregation ATPase
MKKLNTILALAILFAVGTIFTGCQSSASKEEAAQAKVDEAEQELIDAQQEADIEAQKVATAEEWIAFRTESEIKISEYEIRIKALKTEMKKPGKTFDDLYKQRIEQLEQKIADLKARMKDYEKNQTGWESFKREFNHDMDELGAAFKNLTVDNKN